MPRLVFHTFYGEFSGDTPADVVQQLYADSEWGCGPELTMEDWWEYQRSVWKLVARRTLPARCDAAGAPERFLKLALGVGALEEGPKAIAKDRG